MNPPRPSSESGRGGVDAVAASWVVRQRSGLDAVGSRQFAQWRAADPANEEAFQRLFSMSAALDRARLTGASANIVSGLKVRARRRRARRAVLAGLSMAAVVAFGATLYLHGARRPVAAAPLVAFSGGANAIQHLADGTVVELNADSELAVHFDRAVRRVELLRGQAFFHVAKDPLHPFIVRAAGVEARAVGTAFAVRLDLQQVEVLVTEGKVSLDEAAHGRSLLPETTHGVFPPLIAGQRAIVANTLPLQARIVETSAPEMRQRLAWRDARVNFDGMELAAVVEQMNQRNTVRIGLADDAIGKLRISGSFPADDPMVFAQLAAETFGLVCDQRSDGEILLRRR